MPFARPTLRTLIDRVIADINARLPGADARLPASNLNVLANVQAGAAHGLYGYLDFIARQVIIDTAEAEYLERHASIWGITRVPAGYASGNVTLTGTNGSLIPAGTKIQRADGQQYLTTGDATISSGSATAAVVAVVGGDSGNTDAGVAITLVSPISGVNSSGVVAAGGLASGADEETDDALRARLLTRIQQPPHGGSAADYVAWALEVPGVTRAWVTSLGVGSVTVRFVRDNDASIIPDAGEVTAVQTHIDELRPVTASVTVLAPTAVALNFSIAVTPNTAAVKAAVEAELADMLLREAVPGGTILLSHIRAAISLATGETDHTLSVPAANVTHTASQIAVMGTVTWL